MMAESSNSISSKDVSSTVSLYEPSSNTDLLDNLSTRAVYEMDPEDSISRPLSRGSVTSGVSMMATKDGIEGEKVKRLGIPQYSLNILNSMAHNQYKKLHNHSHSHISLNKNHGNGSHPIEEPLINGKFSTYPDSPNSPPMTLREKMRLLNHDRHLPSSNNCSSDNLDEPSVYGKNTSRHYELYSNDNDGNLLAVHGPRSGASDIESNVSTVGDDASFSQNLRNLSPAIGVLDKGHGKE